MNTVYDCAWDSIPGRVAAKVAELALEAAPPPRGNGWPALCIDSARKCEPDPEAESNEWWAADGLGPRVVAAGKAAAAAARAGRLAHEAALAAQEAADLAIEAGADATAVLAAARNVANF